MKNKIISFILLFSLIPFSAGAWNFRSSTEKILKEFSEYIQPETSGNLLIQGNIKVRYIRNKSKFTDKIIINIGKVTRTVKGPWSQASDLKRKCAIESQGDYSICGFYDYSILRVSPTGNYIELIGYGYENWIWRMIDTKTGEIVLSDHVIKSMWSSDKKQFIFQTCNLNDISTPDTCLGGAMTSIYPEAYLGVYLTKLNQFPKYIKIQ